jgi:hypothetical protein
MVAIVVGAALMAVGIGHLIASSLQLQELQFEINERLLLSDKFEPPFWSFLNLHSSAASNGACCPAALSDQRRQGKLFDSMLT